MIMTTCLMAAAATDASGAGDPESGGAPVSVDGKASPLAETSWPASAAASEEEPPPHPAARKRTPKGTRGRKLTCRMETSPGPSSHVRAICRMRETREMVARDRVSPASTGRRRVQGQAGATGGAGSTTSVSRNQRKSRAARRTELAARRGNRIPHRAAAGERLLKCTRVLRHCVLADRLRGAAVTRFSRARRHLTHRDAIGIDDAGLVVVQGEDDA